jgi:hypothetical protein
MYFMTYMIKQMLVYYMNLKGHLILKVSIDNKRELA